MRKIVKITKDGIYAQNIFSFSKKMSSSNKTDHVDTENSLCYFEPKQTLTHETISDLILTSEDIKGKTFKHCYFDNVSFAGVVFEGVVMRDCAFKRVDITGCNFGKDHNGLKIVNGALIYDPGLIGEYPYCCPKEGAFVGYKKVKLCRYYKSETIDYLIDYLILQLVIPEDAKRSSGWKTCDDDLCWLPHKCRCDKAYVQAAYYMSGVKVDLSELSDYRLCSMYDYDFTYTVGQWVKCKKPFDEDRWQTCASGIHFFMTFDEARDYNF